MVPAFVIDPRGQFRHVVRGSIALDVGDFAEVIDRVGGVGRAATDAQDEESSACRAKPDQSIDNSRDFSLREFGADDLRLVQIGLYVLAGFRFHLSAPPKMNSTAAPRFATRRPAGVPWL